MFTIHITKLINIQVLKNFDLKNKKFMLKNKAQLQKVAIVRDNTVLFM